MYLSSPAFDDDESIPGQYGYEKENVNPPLTTGDVQAAAVSLALVMNDPNAKESAGKIWAIGYSGISIQALPKLGNE